MFGELDCDRVGFYGKFQSCKPPLAAPDAASRSVGEKATAVTRVLCAFMFLISVPSSAHFVAHKTVRPPRQELLTVRCDRYADDILVEVVEL